jgi:hypothetical protein
MASIEAERTYENGLRILARMIARAYRQELAEKTAAASLKNNTVEVEDANQRNQRSYQVTPAGQDPAGDQEGDRGDSLSGTDGLLCLSGRGQKGLRRKTSRTTHNVSN